MEYQTNWDDVSVTTVMQEKVETQVLM